MNGKGAAIAKVVGQVVVALLGLLGAALGVWSQGKASDVGAVVKATVERLDARVIPAMQRAQDESRVDVKTVVETVAGLRERLARLEVEISRCGSCRRPFPLPGLENTGPEASADDALFDDWSNEWLFVGGASVIFMLHSVVAFA